MESEIGWLIGLGSLVSFFLILAIVLFTVKYQRKVQLNELMLRDLENRRQREAFTIAIEAEEKQKERISGNLHDSITPELSILWRDLESMSAKAGTGELKDKIGSWMSTLDGCITGIREVSHDLSPKTLSHFGLLKAVEHLAMRISESKAARTSFSVERHPGIPEGAIREIQLSVYRIVQELLQNIMKHSGADEIGIVAEVKKDGLALKVSHNGRGIDAADIEALKKKGLGLSSIESRLLLMNGTIRHWQEDGRFISLVSIPLRSEDGIERVFHA